MRRKSFDALSNGQELMRSAMGSQNKLLRGALGSTRCGLGFRSTSTSEPRLPAPTVEGKSAFRGDQVGLKHFFTQFRDVIFRCSGSVLPAILVELLLAFGLGWLAYFMYHGGEDGSRCR